MRRVWHPSEDGCMMSLGPTPPKQLKMASRRAKKRGWAGFPGATTGVLGAVPFSPFWQRFPTPGVQYQGMGFNPGHLQPSSGGNGNGLLTALHPHWPNLMSGPSMNGGVLDNSSSLHSGEISQDSSASALPQEQMERITSELEALEKTFHAVMSNLDTSTGEDFKRICLQEYRSERQKLQNELRMERERQQLENVKLSQQLEQQYSFIVRSSSCAANNIERKQSINPACRGESGDSFQNRLKDIYEDDPALTGLTRRYLALSCQMAEIECKMEETKIDRDDDPTQFHDITLQMNILMNQMKMVKNEFRHACQQRESALKRITEGRFGMQPLDLLRTLARKTKTWRDFKTFEVPMGEEEEEESTTCANVVSGNNRRKRNAAEISTNDSHSSPNLEKDVIMVSDSDNDEDDVKGVDAPSNMDPYGLLAPVKRWTAREKKQNKHQQKQKVARHVDRCVMEKGVGDVANCSYFVLSGLASVLLEKQERRKMASRSQGQPGTSSQCAGVGEPGQPCVLSEVIGQITSRLELIKPRNVSGVMQMAK